MKQNRITKDEDLNVSPTCGKPLVMGSTVFNEDCMTVMARYPDKYFNLAIVDPPYGIGAGNDVARHKFKDNKKNWDKEVPTHKYFDELFRVSKNQIIWGANYMLGSILPSVPQLKDMNTQCFIVWDKKQPENFTLAMAEYAWTSFSKPAQIFRYSNKTDTNKMHPTQKPVELYDWLFNKFSYCKSCKNEGGFYEDVVGDGGSKMYIDCENCDVSIDGVPKILDTHLGSGSSRISANKFGLEFVGCEIDKYYFEAQEARFKDFVSQLRLFG
jgi:site-specific DNA-methyltransferase (adenine-specific)